MPFYRIPLMPATPQEFTVRLAGSVYRVKVLYRNVPEGGWHLDLYTEGGVALLLGAPLVAGLDIFQQYPYLNMGGELYIATEGDLLAPVSFDMLGKTSSLFFWTET